MTTGEALDLIRTEVEKARISLKAARPSKQAIAKKLYYDWQSCLEIATGIHNTDMPDSLERIMAIKLAVRLR